MPCACNGHKGHRIVAQGFKFLGIEITFHKGKLDIPFFKAADELFRIGNLHGHGRVRMAADETGKGRRYDIFADGLGHAKMDGLRRRASMVQALTELPIIISHG